MSWLALRRKQEHGGKPFEIFGKKVVQDLWIQFYSINFSSIDETDTTCARDSLVWIFDLSKILGSEAQMGRKESPEMKYSM